VKVREGIFPKSSRSEKDPEGGLWFLAIWCGPLVGLPVDRLGSSDILISFLLFRTSPPRRTVLVLLLVLDGLNQLASNTQFKALEIIGRRDSYQGPIQRVGDDSRWDALCC
jgi:hypothetical protein